MNFSDLNIVIPSGATGQIKMLCPRQCSAQRKKSREPCLRVHVEDGVWHCFNCGWSGSLRAKRRLPCENVS